MIRIIVADDHAVVRAGIRRLLESETDMQVVGEAGDGREALALCRAMDPDVAILDLSMPEMDGLEATRRIHEAFPEIRVLVFTMYDNQEFANRFRSAGAAGFLPKKVSHEELPFAVRKVASGNTYFTSSISPAGPAAVTDTGEEIATTLLSEREFQVFLRLAKGLSLSDIAQELLLGYSTVKTYKSRIMEKLHFSSVQEMTKYAIRKSLINEF